MCAVSLCLLVLVFTSSCLISPSFSRSIASRRFCDTGQFLDVQGATCRNCTTTCPENQIIRRTCSAVTDTVCGPFFEFRPQYAEDAEKNRVMQRQRLQKLRKLKGTDWSLSSNDTDAEYSSPFASLPPPPPGPDVEPSSCCRKSVGFLAIFIISTSVVCIVVIVGMVILLTRLRRFRGAGGSRLRTHYHVTIPHVVSSSLSGSVDKRVMHLELQLHRNWQRRAGAGGSQLSAGNDYVKDKLRNSLMLNANTAV